MKKRIDKTLHQRILDDIQQKIVSGDWPPGHHLPFEIELAEHYQCSRMTVNKVMTQLVRAGMIERRRKSGSFVRIPKSHTAILAINEISTEIAALGAQYSWRLLKRSTRKARNCDIDNLKTETPVPLLALDCLHLANGQPFCLEMRLINLANVSEAQTADFDTTPPGNWLIQQVPWSTATNRISAISANTDIARELKITEGAPCLEVERRTVNNMGPVTFVRLIYPGPNHAIIAEFQPGV